jgi:dinuclear metal center YbgI/SA1388 family protein
MTTVGQVCDYLKIIAPLNSAEDWDNVGLLLGDQAAEIKRVLTCLTLTNEVADEAAASSTGLVITHHPILFKPVKKITTETTEGQRLLTLARNNVAVYSPHTAWDNAPAGINQQLADLLKLENTRPLRPQPPADHWKIVTFVPPQQLDQVREAVWQVGAGSIGNYKNCSFNTQGTGTFFGSDSTNPAVGQAGRLESVEEIRMEVICPLKALDKALAALRSAHPYEEPAIDIFSVKAATDGSGAGRFGTLSQPITLSKLTELVSERLKRPIVQFTGDPDQLIQQVGVACGAAAEFLRDAHRAGCQALLTGEARFHACLEAKELGIGLILPGHYATERFAMEVLAERLKAQFPDLVVTSSEAERDPVQSL